MVVDAVSEVLRIPHSTIEPPLEIMTGVDSAYISGVVKLDEKLLIFFDISKIATEVFNEVENITEAVDC